MTYDTYRYIFIGAAILCAVMLIITVILFFVLNIRKVIGDLTGKNAKKEIQKIRQINEESGDKRHKSSSVNRKRGKITDKISESNMPAQKKANIDTGIVTAKIATQNLNADNDSNQAATEETDVLISAMSEETSLLNETGANETSLLGESNGNETALLNETANETTVLNQNIEQQFVFEIEKDITFIHTNEVIC